MPSESDIGGQSNSPWPSAIERAHWPPRVRVNRIASLDVSPMGLRRFACTSQCLGQTQNLIGARRRCYGRYGRSCQYSRLIPCTGERVLGLSGASSIEPAYSPETYRGIRTTKCSLLVVQESFRFVVKKFAKVSEGRDSRYMSSAIH